MDRSSSVPSDAQVAASMAAYAVFVASGAVYAGTDGPVRVLALLTGLAATVAAALILTAHSWTRR